MLIIACWLLSHYLFEFWPYLSIWETHFTEVLEIFFWRILSTRCRANMLVHSQIVHNGEQSGVADWLRALTYNYNKYIQYFHKNRSLCRTLFWDWNEIESTDEFCVLLWLSNRNICGLYSRGLSESRRRTLLVSSGVLFWRARYIWFVVNTDAEESMIFSITFQLYWEDLTISESGENLEWVFLRNFSKNE